MMRWLVIALLLPVVGWSQVKEVWLFADMHGTVHLDQGDSTNYWGYGYYSDESQGFITFPAPKLEFNEGDSVRIYMLNPHPQAEGHTIHLHGLDVDQSNDGVPSTSYFVQTGDTGMYFFVADKPGNYLYHCHVTSVLHVAMGMYGPLVVKAANGANNIWTGGPGYNKEYCYLTSDMDKSWNDDFQSAGHLALYTADRFFVNGKEGSQILTDTNSRINAVAGDTVLTRLMNIGYNVAEYIFPAGLNATVHASDGRPLPSSFQTDTLRVYPGERFSVTLDFQTSFVGYIKVQYRTMLYDDQIGYNEIPINTSLPSGVALTDAKEDALRVYPNPAVNGTVTVELPLHDRQLKEVVVMDITGRQEQVDYHLLGTGIQLRLLGTGMKLIEVRSATRTYRAKVLIPVR